MVPNAFIKLGWFLTMLDLALRCHGMDEEIEATARLLNRPSVQEFARAFITFIQDWARNSGEEPWSAAVRCQAAMAERFLETPDFAHTRDELFEIGQALAMIWRGKSRRLLDRLFGSTEL